MWTQCRRLGNFLSCLTRENNLCMDLIDVRRAKHKLKRPLHIRLYYTVLYCFKGSNLQSSQAFRLLLGTMCVPSLAGDLQKSLTMMLDPESFSLNQSWALTKNVVGFLLPSALSARCPQCVGVVSLYSGRPANSVSCPRPVSA
jgi:hypothetical protein